MDFGPLVQTFSTKFTGLTWGCGQGDRCGSFVGGFGFDDHWISWHALYRLLDTPILFGACEQFADGRGRCGVCDVTYQGPLARAYAPPDADICEIVVRGTPVGER